MGWKRKMLFSCFKRQHLLWDKKWDSSQTYGVTVRSKMRVKKTSHLPFPPVHCPKSPPVRASQVFHLPRGCWGAQWDKEHLLPGINVEWLRYKLKDFMSKLKACLTGRQLLRRNGEKNILPFFKGLIIEKERGGIGYLCYLRYKISNFFIK